MNRQPKSVGLSSSMSPTIAAGLREKDDSATAVGHSPAVSSGSRVNFPLFIRALSPQMSSSKLVCLKSSQLSTESSQLSRKSRLLFAGSGELLAKRSVTKSTCARNLSTPKRRNELMSRRAHAANAPRLHSAHWHVTSDIAKTS